MKTVKLLFLEDVIPTARAGDIKEVKNGFARNYLIPKQLAVIASEHEINRAKKLRDEAQKRRALEIEEWKKLLVDIEKTTLELEVRCGPTGRLYGSVTSSMIAEKLEKSIERYVDRKSIKIKSPIRTIGNYKITTHFFEDISAEITVSVVPDELSEVITSEPDKTTENTEVSDPTFEDVLKETDTSSSDLETDNNKDINEQNTSEITEEIIVESENDNKSSNMEEKNISSDNENTK